MVSHYNRTKETCAGGQGCHWPVSVQMSHMQCAVSILVLSLNITYTPYHKTYPAQPGKCVCCVFFFFFFLFPPSVRMTLLNAFLHILAYIKNRAFQGKCCYECFMPLHIYMNGSELEINARLHMCASRSQIYTSVSVFSPLHKCVIGCSVEAYPRWTYHSYAVKTSASHSSSEKRFWVGLKKTKETVPVP